MELQLNCFSQRRLTTALLCVVAFLIAASTLGQLSNHLLDHGNLFGLVPLFYLDNEASVPTWYSSLALLLASVLLGLVAAAKKYQHDPCFPHWVILGGLFLMLSIDEAVMLREYPIDFLRNHLQASGALHYTWVIPGALFVTAVGLAYSRFLLSLDAKARRGMIAAGFIFLSGAIGVEMISGHHATQFGENNLGYVLIITAEEMLEMLGVVLLIHTLAGILERNVIAVQLRFSGAVTA